MGLRNRAILLFAKIVGKCIALLSLGAGSTWPGHIALALNKRFIREVVSVSATKIVLITGTNGKTTSAKLLEFILKKNNMKVFINSEGANLLNGIATSIIKNSDVNGILNFDVGIFEVDENVLPLVLREIQPHALIILNLFRDQLDRYGEVHTIADKWQKSLKNISNDTHIILNGDDPLLYFLGTKISAKVHYFGLSSDNYKKKVAHDVDSTYCPSCGEKLSYTGISYSHLGNYLCENCGFKKKNVVTFSDDKIQYPLRGKYNEYNTNAVVLSATVAFDLSLKEAVSKFDKFKPTYGRQEEIVYKGRNIFLLLSKNPTGLNQSLSIAKEFLTDKSTQIFFVLNDRIPDGKDVSWIWDVDFEDLPLSDKKIYVAGDRVYDMALRIKYAGFDEGNLRVFEDLREGLEQAVSATAENSTLVILPTYSAMLEIRKLLVGRKIL